MSNSCFSTFSWLADCKASAIAKGSIGKMNAVFPPWPIREFRDRSDGIPESEREDSIFRGAGAFFGRNSNHSGNHPLHYGGLWEERRRAANRESIPEQRIGPRGRTEALRETLRRVPWSNSRGNRARAVPSRVCAFCRAPHAAYIH